MPSPPPSRPRTLLGVTAAEDAGLGLLLLPEARLGVCQSPTDPSEEQVSRRASLWGLYRACHTQWACAENAWTGCVGLMYLYNQTCLNTPIRYDFK